MRITELKERCLLMAAVLPLISLDLVSLVSKKPLAIFVLAQTQPHILRIFSHQPHFNRTIT
jgi:hypothetical protein